MEASTAPIDTKASADEATAKKHRISLAEVRRLDEPGPDPDRLPEPPTVRLRGDETPKRVLAPAPPSPKRSLWRRLVGLFRRR